MPLTCLLILLTSLSGQSSPMLSYQAADQLKQRLAEQIVEVESFRKPTAGENEAMIPPLAGQGVCIISPTGQKWLVVSQYLVDGTSSIRARSRGHPQWTSITVTHRIAYLGIALMNPGAFSQHCPSTPLAPGSLLLKSPVAYTVDTPLGWPNIFWAVVGERAEPPLHQFLISPVGLPLSCPLFSQNAELIGINIRPLLPGSKLALAVTSLQLRRLLFQRAPWSTQRLDRRTIHN